MEEESNSRFVADSAYSPQSRAERLIAAGRVVLAAFSLLAIWLDPSEPTKYANTTYALLAVYVAYSVLIAAWVWSTDTPLGRLGLLTHIADLAAFSLFMYLTEGPTSPFFVYFIFSLVCGTVRWQWRGALWTAAAALAAFLGLGFYAGNILNDPHFELNRFIIRAVYLAVTATLLGYLGAYEQQLHHEIYQLSTWPQANPRGQAPLRELLETAASIFGAPRVLLAWEEPEEPWLHLAWWSNGRLKWTRHPPNAFDPLVAGSLAETAFLCTRLRTPAPTVLHTSSNGFGRFRGAPLHQELLAQFPADAVVGLPLKGVGMAGYLFFLDKPRMTSDDLMLGEIIARQVTARLDHFNLLQKLKQGAVTEERIRLARDLHDGLLQSLAGAALQLQTVERLLEENPQSARERLLDIQRLISAEQRDLRFFIQELRPAPAGPPGSETSLSMRLVELGGRFERFWGLRVEVRALPVESVISDSLANQIYRIVHEALANAARHAGASAARVEVGLGDNSVHILVADNGHGFRFRGHYDHATLMAEKMGPVSLKERIDSLHGTLAIDSSESGARLEISLPLVKAEA